VVGILRGLFKGKQKSCERCGNPDVQTHLLDETWRGRFSGEKLRLCLSCLKQALEPKFEGYRGRCLVLEPVAESNAFYGYTASNEDMRLIENVPEKARDAIETLLERISGRCGQCGDQLASFLWVPASAFDGKWWNVGVVQFLRQPGEGFKPLCGACAQDRIVGAIERLRIRLDEMQPPIDEAILMFSGES